MTQPNINNSDLKKTQFWNRVQLISVLIVFAAPIVGAFLYKPSGFINFGDIYTPVRPVENLVMNGPDGSVEFDSLRRQWVFLVTANGVCAQVCEDNLLKVRQLRFMQNNDMMRIRTIFLHTGLEQAVASDLAAKYSPVEAYQSATEDYLQWTEVLKNDQLEQGIERGFYIIDPAGNLMMSYPVDADPNFIKEDIKRLLKASQIG